MSKELTEKEKEVFSYFNNTLDNSPIKPEELMKGEVLAAQELFLCFTPVAEISRETGIAYSLLRSLIYAPGGWRDQRDLMHKEVKELAKEKARRKLEKAYSVSIRLITNGLLAFEKQLERKKRKASLEEMLDVGKLMTRLDNAQLNNEDPNKEKRESFTVKELIKSISQDPYLQKSFAANSQATIEEEEGEFEPIDTRSDSLAHPSE